MTQPTDNSLLTKLRPFGTRLVFVFSLLLIIGSKKIFGGNTVSGGGLSMSTYVIQLAPMLGIFFCLVLPGILGIIALISAVYRVYAGKDSYIVSNQLIDEAPINWLFSKFIGWVYVDSNTQVGLIGHQIYLRSGVFLELSSASKRKKVISTRKLPYSVTVSASASDHFLFDQIDFSTECKIRKDKVNDLINKIENPSTYLQSGLESSLITFVQGEKAEILVDNKVETQKRLTDFLRKKLPYYDISVSSLTFHGEHPKDLDKIARFKNTAQIEIFNAKIRLQEGVIGKAIDKMLIKYLADDIGQGRDSTPFIRQMIGQISQIGVDAFINGGYDAPPPITQIGDNGMLGTGDSQDVFRTNLERSLSRSPFRLIQDDGNKFEIEYLGYTVTLILDNLQNSIQYLVYDPQKKKLADKQSKSSVEQLLVELQKGIEILHSRS